MATLGKALGALVGLFLFAQLASWAAWFAPAVVLVVIGVRKNLTFRRFMPVLGIGLVLSAVWTSLLLKFGAKLPYVVQLFLAIPLQPTEGVPAAGRYDPGPSDGSDLFGFVYLGAVAGATLILQSALFAVTARISESQAVRVWSLRFGLVAVVAGGTWLLWRLHTGWHVLFGIVAYLFSFSFFLERADPRAILKEYDQ